jgi:precorrin isomerase
LRSRQSICIRPSHLFSCTQADTASGDHSTTQDSLNQLKDAIEGTKEDLEDQLGQVRQVITTAEASLGDMLRVDQARLQRSLDSLAQAQTIIDHSKPQIVIERNRAEQGSRALFGTDTSQPRFNLTASDNEAQLGAVMAAGVHSPQTLQALLGKSWTADLALVLQALQTQSPSTISTTLQSHLNNISAADRQGLTDRPSTTNISPSLRVPEQEDTPDVVEMPSQSTSAVHKDDGKYDEASR